MNEIPDILGMRLEEAETLLSEEGFIFCIRETKPPRPPRETYSSSELRVIKITDLRQNNIETQIKEGCSNIEGKELLVTVCMI